MQAVQGRTLISGPYIQRKAVSLLKAVRSIAGPGRTLNAGPYDHCRGVRSMQRPYDQCSGRTLNEGAVRSMKGPYAQCRGRTLNAGAVRSMQEPYAQCRGRTLNAGAYAPCRAARSMQGRTVRTINAGPYGQRAMQDSTFNEGPLAQCRGP